MQQKEVIDLYNQLENIEIKIWIDGGWAVDALLEKQTRPHNDLDIAIQQKDIPKFKKLLELQKYKIIKRGGAKPHNFVMGNNKGKEVDVHVIVLNEKGDGIYGPAENGEMYPAESLTGTGTIEGQTVRCISPKYMVEFLAPWIHKWPEKYLQAVADLCEKFNIPLPEEYKNFKKY